MSVKPPSVRRLCSLMGGCCSSRAAADAVAAPAPVQQQLQPPRGGGGGKKSPLSFANKPASAVGDNAIQQARRVKFGIVYPESTGV